MKSFTTATIFAVGLGCITLGAQNTGTQTGTGTGTGTQTGASTAGQARGGGNPVMLVGCLQRAGAGQTTAGTTGATSAGASTGEGFVLANAMRSPNMTTGTASSTASSSGVTAPDGSGQAMMTYTLEGNAADLTPHVGHRIEVTGMMMGGRGGGRGAGATTGGATTGGTTTGTGTATGTGASTTGAGAGTATGTGTATGAGATTAGAGAGRGMSPRFTVTAVRMISADCGAAR